MEGFIHFSDPGCQSVVVFMWTGGRDGFYPQYYIPIIIRISIMREPVVQNKIFGGFHGNSLDPISYLPRLKPIKLFI